jgi:hypothetical protein
MVLDSAKRGLGEGQRFIFQVQRAVILIHGNEFKKEENHASKAIITQTFQSKNIQLLLVFRQMQIGLTIQIK